MDENLIFFPDKMGKTLTLKVSYPIDNSTQLQDSVNIIITQPNIGSTENDRTNLYLKSADQTGKFLCSKEVN